MLTDWQPVLATVTVAREYHIQSQPQRPPTYKAEFEYTYSFEDRRYVSHRYRPGNKNSWEAVCSYQVGDSLTAFVDPGNPAYSVVEQSVPKHLYGLWVIGMLALLHVGVEQMLQNPSLGGKGRLIRVYRTLSALTGIAILGGGIGYLIYGLVYVSTATCVT